MASLFTNPGQWFKDFGKSAERDWKNAGRGEIGRYVAGVGQSAYNLTLAVPRAVKTGQWSKEFQRGVFSAANLYSYGALDYAGRSSGIKNAVGTDPVIGKNLFAFARLTSTGAREGKVSNSDRNLAIQGAVKVAAVGAAAYGASAAYSSWWAAPKAGVDGVSLASVGAESARAGTVGVLQAPAWGSSGAAASTTAISSTNAALSSSAASSGFWSSGFWKGTKAFAGDLAKGFVTASLLPKGGGGGGGGMIGAEPGGGFAPSINIGGLPGEGGYSDYGPGPYPDSFSEGDSGTAGKVLLVGALAVGALVIYKAVRK